jgi:hypothetical protein
LRAGDEVMGTSKEKRIEKWRKQQVEKEMKSLDISRLRRDEARTVKMYYFESTKLYKYAKRREKTELLRDFESSKLFQLAVDQKLTLMLDGIRQSFVQQYSFQQPPRQSTPLF